MKLHRRLDANGLLAEPPAWARRLLGDPPTDEARRIRWRDAVTAVADYRRFAEIRDNNPNDDPYLAALGPLPEPGSLANKRWRSTRDQVERARRDLRSGLVNPGELTPARAVGQDRQLDDDLRRQDRYSQAGGPDRSR
jgi:hypothetical protein